MARLGGELAYCTFYGLPLRIATRELSVRARKIALVQGGQPMGFFSNFMDKGRGPRIEQDMNKMAPIVKQLKSGAHKVEFANLLFVVMRATTACAANMTKKGQKSYGMDLQMKGLDVIDRNMMQGASAWLAGAFIETNSTETELCRDLSDFLGDLIKDLVSARTEDAQKSGSQCIPNGFLDPT